MHETFSSMMARAMIPVVAPKTPSFASDKGKGLNVFKQCVFSPRYNNVAEMTWTLNRRHGCRVEEELHVDS